MVVVAAIRRLVLSEMTQGPNGTPIELLSTPKDIQLLRVNYRQVMHANINFISDELYSVEEHISTNLYYV